MDAMDSVFGKRGERPNTPDFWRISEVLLRNDGAVDDAAKADKEGVWKSIAGEVVDIPSALYMAEQRVIKVFGPVKNLDELPQRIKMVTLVMDTFLVGAYFQKAGGHRENFPT